MILYTPAQIAAARALVSADEEVWDYLHDEPHSEGRARDEWDDGYEAACARQQAAAGVFAHLFGDIDPYNVIEGAPTNPLHPTAPGVSETGDGRFIAGPERLGQDKGLWMVDLYDPPLLEHGTRRVLTIRATGYDHAQQLVDLASWALGAGARTDETA
ncbi:hypothetical protein D5S18_24835 [Nocardia panacis]|uniref:Uncharacterized protein n=1 Tax=Nocardia panacis TaxID=2340916 RepID=A0A3A4JX21_9NOCA|nr:hypothetical protein [Nocardia panacis]RJO71401.1 hypothetical protein D5S18_24835 [Nocardia panacis]